MYSLNGSNVPKRRRYSNAMWGFADGNPPAKSQDNCAQITYGLECNPKPTNDFRLRVQLRCLITDCYTKLSVHIYPEKLLAFMVNN